MTALIEIRDFQAFHTKLYRDVSHDIILDTFYKKYRAIAYHAQYKEVKRAIRKAYARTN